MRRASLSVVIPCYNAEAHLAEAIESVLTQREVTAELVVVDDGSTDASAAIASAYSEVRLIRTANRGVSAARNRGIAEARGTLLKFLDADDKLLPGALARQLQRSKALAPHELPFGDYLCCGQGDARRKRSSQLSSRCHLASVILADIHPSTPLHRRELLEGVGGFDERFATDEDWNLHVRLAAAGARFRRFPEVISQYRIHEAAHRLSNAKLRVGDYIVGELERLRWTRDAVQAAPLSDAAFARRAIWLARVAQRRGEPEAAQRCLAAARAIAPEHYLRFLSMRHRALVAVLGAERGEAALLAYWACERRERPLP